MKVYQILRRSVMSMIIHGAMIGGGLVMVASALTPVTASARSAEDFYFTNNTGTTITGLYLAAHGTNQTWGQNCLSAPLSPGYVFSALGAEPPGRERRRSWWRAGRK